MSRSSLVGHSLAIVALTGLTARCHDPKTVSPVSPTGPAAQSVEILGPDTVAPGQSVQYAARVIFPDGSTKIITPETHATWRSTNGSLTIERQTGLATAGSQSGDTVLSVDVPLGDIGIVRRGSKPVVVVPEGTYRLAGVVSDAEFPSLRLAGARVEVTPGPLVTTTSSEGGYRLYGVPADAEVRVTKDGYEPATRSLHLTGHATENFALALPGPRPNLSGAYTLAVDVVGSCALSPEQQHRRYEAVVTQDGFRLDVSLTEPRFKNNAAGKGHRFSGQAEATGATFWLDALDYYYYSVYPSLAELLPDGSVLVIEGRATTSWTEGKLVGTLTGSFTRWIDMNWLSSPVGACYSAVHDFAFTPR